MRRIENPSPTAWKALCERPQMNQTDLTAQVKSILDDVKNNGDEALVRYSESFDQVTLTDLKVSKEELQSAASEVSESLKKAIGIAQENITKFHQSQRESTQRIETTPGVVCWRKSVAIQSVGLYIPGGSAPLFSSILMLGIPAQIAGCEEVVLCTPPQKDGTVNPVIRYCANLLGIKQVFKVGGSQAIAAMAYGTATIPSVNKIFGPGNQYVTKAKDLIQTSGVAIDMPAGPSEVLVIADETAIPSFVASDLLSQAEHGIDSQVLLLTTSERIADEVEAEVNKQLNDLPRKSIAEKALSNSRTIIFKTPEQCLAMSNTYAPEHLILASNKASTWLSGITNAGSVFIGNYSCESAGDYASGTNHTLPTNGYATSYSGVSLDSFVKKITFQEVSKAGIQELGPSIELMAEAEGLFAHKNAVSLRLKAE